MELEDKQGELELTIEDLQSEKEKLELDAQAKEEENSLAGKMSDIVNQARYKRELDELKEKVKLTAAQQQETIARINKENNDEQERLMAMLQENEAQIKKAENTEAQAKNIVINIQQAEHVVHVRPIETPTYVYCVDPEARVRVLESEREEITQKVQREYRKKIADMEINILAYQDLLLTKDAEIKSLEAQTLR